MLSSTVFIRLRFEGCKSSTAIFAWRVTGSLASAPLRFHVKCEKDQTAF